MRRDLPVSNHLRTIAVESIAPSLLNPRKRFDEAEIAELAQSLQQDGVLQPLVVRPIDVTLDDKAPGETLAAAAVRAAASFELIAGERRWRAARHAGLETVPAVVRTDLDDVAVRRLMLVENVQRQDLRPLEEADACQALLDADPDTDMAALADLIGRSSSWIYQRLQLRRLTEACRASVEAGRLSAGQAVEIARLQPDDQDLALAECDFTGRDVPDWKQPASVRDLKSWIRDHVPLGRRDPAAALRGKPIITGHYIGDDAALSKQEKRAILKPDKYVAVRKTDACGNDVQGVVVLGVDAGKLLRICPRSSKCETHWAARLEDEAAYRERQKKAYTADQDRRDAERARFDAEVLPRIDEALAQAVLNDAAAARAVHVICTEERWALRVDDVDLDEAITEETWFEWLLRLAIHLRAYGREELLERARGLLPHLDVPADVCKTERKAGQ